MFCVTTKTESYMDPLNKILQETFYFSTHDLRINRTGNLSKLQIARRKALSFNIILAILVFIFIMLGSLVIFWYGSLVSGTNVSAASYDNLVGGVILCVIVLIIIIYGIISGLIYLSKAGSKQIKQAEGVLEYGKTNHNSAYYEIKLGQSKIRLLTEEQRDAFQVGKEYRIFYIPSSSPTILSAEAIGADINDASEDTMVEEDEIIKKQINARAVVIVLALLTILIPITLFATASYPPIIRFVIISGLLGISVGFVNWAIRRTGGKQE